MTDRDVLKRASEALRDATEPTPEELTRLRARVLSRGKVTPLRRGQKRKNLRWILPLAAAFIAGSALAATPGALDGMLNAVERYLDIELFGRAHQTAHTPAARKSQTRTDALSPLSAVTPEPDLVPASDPVNVPVPAPMPDSPSPSPSSPARARSPRPEPRTAPEPQAAAEPAAAPSTAAQNEPPTATGPSRDLALYKKAHALHFRERRYDEALFAWEEYLGLVPAPTFALEARYNRALCLLRLGHYEEARAALVPFAAGRYPNAYRRDEAKRFIETLDKRR